MGYNLDRLAADPAYAPGIVQAKDLLYWRCSRSYIKQGYTSATIKLPGRAGDGRDLERAAKCRDYAREVIQWAADLEKPKVEPGTWRWLIQRYRSDEFSPYREVKANTRADYDFALNRWADKAGHILVADTDHVMIRRWQRAMEEAGRSLHYIRAMFTKLRIVAGYAVMLKLPGARDVRDVLSEMRFRAAPQRDVAPTFDQVQAIIAAADKAGQPGFALGLSLQWWLALRAVDVRGQIIDGQWQDGLTWGMIDLAAGAIRKTPSKTEHTTARAMEWSLGLLPDIRARLEAIPADQRVGIVIRQKDGAPFTKRRWAELFRTFAAEAGVPDEVRCMDLRAGAITEAKNLGASITDLQHAATHASPATTNRYMRDREGAGDKVIALRRTAAQRG